MNGLRSTVGVLAALLWLGGCGAGATPTPTATAAEKEKSLVRDGQLGRCGDGSPTARMAARDYRYGGSEAFDTRGCGSAP